MVPRDSSSDVEWLHGAWLDAMAFAELGWRVAFDHRVAARAGWGRAGALSSGCDDSDPPHCGPRTASLLELSGLWSWRYTEHTEIIGMLGATRVDPDEGLSTDPGGGSSVWLPLAGVRVSWLVGW